MNSQAENTKKDFFNRWSLTGFISILLFVNVFIIILLNGINEKETVSLLIRSTAKLSFVLFMLAFVASSLRYYINSNWTRWLLLNRRYIGVSFAISHYLHLGALILMTYHIDFNVFEDRGLFRTAFGALAYAFISIMTLTSFDRTRDLFGANNWKTIHTIGGYLIWIIFTKSYVLDLSSLINIVFALVAIGVLILRVSVVIKKKSKVF